MMRLCLVMPVLVVLAGCSRQAPQMTNATRDHLVTSTPTTEVTDIPELDVHPVAVRKGMTTAEALTHLADFTPCGSTDRADERLKFRQPWEGGYHYVSLDVSHDRIVKVSEMWIDP